MNIMISPVPLPEAVGAPAASLQSHHHALNLTLGDHRHHNLRLLPPPAKPSSLKPPEEPSCSPLRAAEAPYRPIKKEGLRPTRKSSTTDVLRLMDALSLPLPAETYLSLMKECTVSGDSEEALEVHRHLRRSGLRTNLGLLNRLLLMHVSCGCMRAARRLFDEMPHRDSLSWAVLFAAIMEEGNHDEAIRMFVGIQERFRSSEVPSWMVGCVLKACVSSMNVELGKQVHGWILKTGGVLNNKPILSRLINLYRKFRSRNYVNAMFDQRAQSKSIAWTPSIVSRYKEKRFREVAGNFQESGRTRIGVSSRMISSALKASCHMKDGGNCGKQIHASAIKVGVETCAHVQSGLVGMYARNGLLINARRVYDEMATNKKHRVMCSNFLIEGYLRDGYSVEAIKLLYEMKAEGIWCRKALLDEVRVLSGS